MLQEIEDEVKKIVDSKYIEIMSIPLYSAVADFFVEFSSLRETKNNGGIKCVAACKDDSSCKIKVYTTSAEIIDKIPPSYKGYPIVVKLRQ